MLRSGLASRLLRSTVHGAALGAWWGLCIVATIRTSEAGWGVVALDAAHGRDVFRWDLVVHHASTRAGLGFVRNAWDLVLALPFAGACAGVLLSLGARVLGVDGEQIASRPFRELMQRKSHVVAWLAPGIGLALASCIPGLGSWLFLPVLVWGAAVPFLFLHDDVVAAPSDARAWRPNWPGAKAVATSLGILLVAGIFDQFMEVLCHFGPTPVAVLAQAASLLVGCLATLLGVAAWLDRSGPRQLQARLQSLLAWRSVGAMLSLQVRFAILCAWLAPPLLALVVSEIWAWPQLEEVASTQHPVTSTHILHSLRLIANNGPMLLFVLLAPVVTYAEGRLYRLIFAAPPIPGDAGDSMPR